MDGDKPPFAKEIEDKVDEIKGNLKHVETQEKTKLPTQADIEAEKKESDKKDT
ncbi:22333_t:CDS:2 [Dentiscutata erythropus]|uniref:22333_t:CDS:1 n=1 Tax=Dentiscutata erythropus TaxID=1348616 RepID=A0A9N8YVY1_9GLOM|nr:22333_t:CDS:2 [Dentiscutata erythropus]